MGHLVFAELKTEKGRFSHAQLNWLGRLEEVAGWPTDAVDVFTWRPSMWAEIERVLAR